MIRLDGIDLPGGLLWADEHATTTVAQTVRRALDGSLVVFYGPLQKGVPITLESEPDAGWLTLAQVEAVKLRSSSPGGVYVLEIRGQTLPVMFRHHDPPAFEARALIPRPNPEPGDFFLATLKLLTV